MNVYLVPLDPNNLQHTDFLLKLYRAEGKTYYDDSTRDPILRLNETYKMVDLKEPKHFMVIKDGNIGGVISAMIYPKRVAELDGAGLRNIRCFFSARKAVVEFCQYLFEVLNIHKIKATVPTFNRDCEELCRSVGFMKEGLLFEEMEYHGKRIDAVALYLLGSNFISRFDEYKQIKRQRKNVKAKRTKAANAAGPRTKTRTDIHKWPTGF